MTVKVSLLAQGMEDAWDAFVRAQPMGTFFHLAGWKHVIENAFAHRTYYLMAQRDGRVCGVLPLTRIQSPLFGHTLISNAFCVFGGPVASDTEARAVLEAEAERIGREFKVRCIEFRLAAPTHSHWTCRDGLYVNFRRPIHANLEDNMRAIPRKQRAMVRKGMSNALLSVCDDTVDRLHQVYAQSVRNLGTPVFSKRYFQMLKSQFAADCDIVTVLHQDEPVASVMNFYFRGQVLPYYGGGTAKAREFAANDFMYWEVMRRAWEKGAQIFDFGRSKIGTGSYNFKRNWGFEPEPIYCEFLPIASSKLPNVNPLNPKYSLMIAAWKRLPLPITNLIGPAIVRQIG